MTESGEVPSTSKAFNQNSDISFIEDFEYDLTECHACGGFYGPSFSNPLCATCHSFLYPYDVRRPITMLLPSSGDDNDSGNDEPSDPSPLVAAGATGGARGSVSNNVAGGDQDRSRGSRRCSDLGEPSSSNSNNLHHGNPHTSRSERPTAAVTPHHNFADHPPLGLPNPPSASGIPQNDFMRDHPAWCPSVGSDDSNDEDEATARCTCVPDDDVPQRCSCVFFNDALTYRLGLLTVPQHYHHTPSRPQLYSVLSLPPEILLVIFSHLDDLSLWCASRVCSQWRRLIQGHIPNERWQRFVAERFPLYVPAVFINDWYIVATVLIESSSCMQCLFDMKRKMEPAIRESSWRRRILHEVRTMKQEPPEGVSASPLDHDYCLWQATISGPCGSPYEGGLFYLFLKVPYTYPMDPPQVRFLTKIFHPNISRHGDVGIDSITHNWSLALTINKILVSVQSLLTDPYCQVCMEPEVGRLYMTDLKRFNAIARAWTWKYGMADMLIPTPFPPSYYTRKSVKRRNKRMCKCTMHSIV